MSDRRPWDKHCDRLLEPGWAGSLDPSEFEHIRQNLVADKELAYWWGFRRSTKRRPELAVRSVAAGGDADSRGCNARLVAEASSKAPFPGIDSPVSATKEKTPVPEPTHRPPESPTEPRMPYQPRLVEA